MVSSASVLTGVVLGSALLAGAIAVVAWRERPDPMAVPLALLMTTAVLWAVPHALSFSADTVGAVAFWHRLRYVGTLLAPTAYLLFALKYAGYDRWLSRRTYAVLSVMPLLTILVVWTNPLHGLFWAELGVTTVEGASIFTPTYGPWYWGTLAYLYALSFLSLAVLASVVITAGPVYRYQAGLMFVGGFVPLATNGIVNFDIGPAFTVDFTTTAFAVSGLTFALALFYFDLLNVQPVARDRLIEELDDGVVVVGPEGRVRDFNPRAANILDDIAVDRPAAAVFPSAMASDGGELVATVDGRERTFRTRTTTLTDGRGAATGRIIYLNEVTDLVDREQRISVLNRILRHNVRNELVVITAHLEALDGAVETDGPDHVGRALASTDRVVELAEKARVVERTLQDDTEMVVDAAGVAEEVVDDARQQYPEATVEFDAEATDGRVRIVDRELLELALSELVENGIVHDDSDAPRVHVRLAAEGSHRRIVVADSGPGIPDGEVDALETQTETQFQHGSGIGLWLVEWTATLSSGDLTFDADEEGTTATLTLPAAES